MSIISVGKPKIRNLKIIEELENVKKEREQLQHRIDYYIDDIRQLSDVIKRQDAKIAKLDKFKGLPKWVMDTYNFNFRSNGITNIPVIVYLQEDGDSNDASKGNWAIGTKAEVEIKYVLPHSGMLERIKPSIKSSGYMMKRVNGRNWYYFNKEGRGEQSPHVFSNGWVCTDGRYTEKLRSWEDYFSQKKEVIKLLEIAALDGRGINSSTNRYNSKKLRDIVREELHLR